MTKHKKSCIKTEKENAYEKVTMNLFEGLEGTGLE